MESRYRLRKAAGSFWLLDMAQHGKIYKKPLELNESGAKIWELACAGKDLAAIAEYLSGEYEIELEEAKEDVRQFFACLKSAGFFCGMK